MIDLRDRLRTEKNAAAIASPREAVYLGRHGRQSSGRPWHEPGVEICRQHVTCGKVRSVTCEIRESSSVRGKGRIPVLGGGNRLGDETRLPAMPRDQIDPRALATGLWVRSSRGRDVAAIGGRSLSFRSAPPSADITYTCPALSCDRPRTNAISWPSGDQLGFASGAGSVVSRRTTPDPTSVT